MDCQNCVTSGLAAKKSAVEPETYARPTLILEIFNLQNFDKLQTNRDTAVVSVATVSLSFFCHQVLRRLATRTDLIANR